MVLNDYLASASIFLSISALISSESGTMVSSNPWNLEHAYKIISDAPFYNNNLFPSNYKTTPILFLDDEKGNESSFSYFSLYFSY